jgi:hypothetical protein
MNDHYLSHWQNSVSGLLDKDNYFETINGCFEQALTGFEWVLSLMKQAPQQCNRILFGNVSTHVYQLF